MTTIIVKRIKEKLDQIVLYYDELLEDFPSEEEFQQNRLTRRGIEKTVELIAEGIIDTAMMLISLQGLEKPNDSRAAIALLEKKGILSSTPGKKIQDFISFRNLLVHRYAVIDEEREYATIAENHEDIIFFVKEIEQFLQKKEPRRVKK